MKRRKGLKRHKKSKRRSQVATTGAAMFAAGLVAGMPLAHAGPEAIRADFKPRSTTTQPVREATSPVREEAPEFLTGHLVQAVADAEGNVSGKVLDQLLTPRQKLMLSAPEGEKSEREKFSIQEVIEAIHEGGLKEVVYLPWENVQEALRSRPALRMVDREMRNLKRSGIGRLKPENFRHYENEYFLSSEATEILYFFAADPSAATVDAASLPNPPGWRF